MKKLMFVAAIAAVAAVQAACIDPTTPVPGPVVLDNAVYAWQFKGRTGTGVLIKDTQRTNPTGGGCVDVTPGSVTTTAEVIRVPGSLAIVAYSYHCDTECTGLTVSAGDLVTPTKAQYYATAPFKSTIVPYRGKTFITAIDVAHVIGKAKNQFELGGTAQFKFDDASDLAQTYDITFAGFGAYDKNNGRFTSVSGNFAGKQTPPKYMGKVTGLPNCPSADYWDCTTLTFAGDAEAPSVAYGTWSVKYNAAAARKLATDKTNYWVK